MTDDDMFRRMAKDIKENTPDTVKTLKRRKWKEDATKPTRIQPKRNRPSEDDRSSKRQKLDNDSDEEDSDLSNLFGNDNGGKKAQVGKQNVQKLVGSSRIIGQQTQIGKQPVQNLTTSSNKLSAKALVDVPPRNNVAVAPPLKTPQAGKPALTWHDILVAEEMDVSNTDIGFLANNLALPAATPLSKVPTDGTTPVWVDLPTYLTIMQTGNNQVTPTARRPRLNQSWFATTSFWFLDPSDNSKMTERSCILVWWLMSLLMGPDYATETITALPLNSNGPASATLDPFQATGGNVASPAVNLAVWSMMAKNFRALIVVPTLAQYQSGRWLDTRVIQFEIVPPPVRLNTISKADFYTWTVSAAYRTSTS